jgi:hypothetical protein
MAFACKYCIASKGLRGSDIASLPQTQEDLIAHIEGVHHIRVMRAGESDEECEARFLREHPEAKDCPECLEAREEA